MAGYKRKSYTNKRSTGARRAPVKRTYKKRSTYTPSDSITQYVSSYFEVKAEQANDTTAMGGNLCYSIKCDALDATLAVAKAGPQGSALLVTSVDANNHALASHGIGTDAVNGTVAFARLTSFAAMYRQYRINSVSIKVTTDRDCGLDNPLIMLTDKGDATPVSLVGAAMNQPHKSKILTESDRTMSYGWKPSTAQDREFRMVGQSLNAVEQTFLKVIQEIEPHPGKKCTHRIEIGMSVTLKDGKN